MSVGCILLELISPAERFSKKKNWEQVSIWVSFSSTQEVVEEVWGEIMWCQINSESVFVVVEQITVSITGLVADRKQATALRLYAFSPFVLPLSSVLICNPFFSWKNDQKVTLILTICQDKTIGNLYLV